MENSSFDENAILPLDDDDRELEALADADGEASELLPELVRALAPQLAAAGLPIDDPVALAGAEPELRAAWERVQDAAGRVGSDDPEARAEVRAAMADVALLRDALLPEGVRPGSGIAVEDGADDAYAADVEAGAEGETEPDDRR